MADFQNLYVTIGANYQGLVSGLGKGATAIRGFGAQADTVLRKVDAQSASAAASIGKVASSSKAAAAATSRIGSGAGGVAGVGGQAEQASRKVGGLTGKLGGLGASLKSLGGMAMGLGLIAGVGQIVGATLDYEKSMQRMKVVTGATNAQMTLAGKTALQLGNDMSLPGSTAVEAADAMKELAGAGGTAIQAIKGSRSVLELQAASMANTETAAVTLGDAMDQFGLRSKSTTQYTKNAAHVADVLSSSTTMASMSLQQMYDGLKYVGPTAHSMGISLDQVSGSMVLLSKNGIKGEQAGTSLRSMLQSLAAPSKIASAAMDDLGVKAWNSQGRFVGLPKVIDQLNSAQKRFGPSSQRFQADIARAFGATAASAIAAFATAGGKELDDYTAKVGRAGQAAKIAAANADTIRGQAGNFMKLIQSAGDTAVTTFSGPAVTSMKVFNGILSLVVKGIQKFKDALVIGGAVVAGLWLIPKVFAAIRTGALLSAVRVSELWGAMAKGEALEGVAAGGLGRFATAAGKARLASVAFIDTWGDEGLFAAAGKGLKGLGSSLLSIIPGGLFTAIPAGLLAIAAGVARLEKARLTSPEQWAKSLTAASDAAKSTSGSVQAMYDTIQKRLGADLKISALDNAAGGVSNLDVVMQRAAGTLDNNVRNAVEHSWTWLSKTDTQQQAARHELQNLDSSLASLYSSGHAQQIQALWSKMQSGQKAATTSGQALAAQQRTGAGVMGDQYAAAGVAAQQATKRLTTSQKTNAVTLADMQKRFPKLTQAIKDSASAQGVAIKSTKDLNKYLGSGHAIVIKYTKDQLKALTQQRTAWAKAYNDSIDPMSTWSSMVTNTTAKGITDWEKFKNGATVNLQAYAKELQSQVDARKNYAKNMKALVDSGAPSGAIDALLKQGMSAAPLVQELVTGDASTRKTILGLMGQLGSDSGSAFAAGMQKRQNLVDQIGSVYGKSVQKRVEAELQSGKSVAKVAKEWGISFDGVTATANGTWQTVNALAKSVASLPKGKSLTITAPNNPKLLQQLRDMGIKVKTLPNGKVRLSFPDYSTRRKQLAVLAANIIGTPSHKINMLPGTLPARVSDMKKLAKQINDTPGHKIKITNPNNPVMLSELKDLGFKVKHLPNGKIELSLPNYHATVRKIESAVRSRTITVDFKAKRFGLNGILGDELGIRGGKGTGLGVLSGSTGTVYPRHFAGGGDNVLDGHTPGRDIYRFSSPDTGTQLMLGGGEGVANTNAVDGMGRGRFNAWQAAARSGGPGAGEEFLRRQYGGRSNTVARANGGTWSFRENVGQLQSLSDSYARTVGKAAKKAIAKSEAAGMKNVSGSAKAWVPAIRKAAAASGVKLTASALATILRRINQESGGNPTIQNNWDSNAAKGTPSKGLLQYIQPTLNKYARRGHNNLGSGYDQLLALFNDRTWLADISVKGGWGPRGGRRFSNRHGGIIPTLYDQGGVLHPGVHVVENRTGKPEMIFPAAATTALQRLASGGTISAMTSREKQYESLLKTRHLSKSAKAAVENALSRVKAEIKAAKELNQPGLVYQYAAKEDYWASKASKSSGTSKATRSIAARQASGAASAASAAKKRYDTEAKIWKVPLSSAAQSLKDWISGDFKALLKGSASDIAKAMTQLRTKLTNAANSYARSRSTIVDRKDEQVRAVKSDRKAVTSAQKDVRSARAGLSTKSRSATAKLENAQDKLDALRDKKRNATSAKARLSLSNRIAAQQKVVASAKKSASSADKADKKAAARYKAAKARLQAAIKDRDRDSASLAKSRAALAKLDASYRNIDSAKKRAAALDALAKKEKQLQDTSKALAAEQTRLDQANTIAQQGLSDTSLSSMSGASSYTMLLHQQANLGWLNSYIKNLGTLSSWGLNGTDYKDIVDAGFINGGKIAAALVAGGKDLITGPGGLNDVRTQINAGLTSLSTGVGTNDTYQSGVAADDAITQPLQDQVAATTQTLSDLAAAVASTTAKILDIDTAPTAPSTTKSAKKSSKKSTKKSAKKSSKKSTKKSAKKSSKKTTKKKAKKKAGGQTGIVGVGYSRTDTEPYLLSKHESILAAPVTSALGPHFIDAVNQAAGQGRLAILAAAARTAAFTYGAPGHASSGVSLSAVAQPGTMAPVNVTVKMPETMALLDADGSILARTKVVARAAVQDGARAAVSAYQAGRA